MKSIMNIMDTFFIIAFLGILGILGYRLYSIMSEKMLYDTRLSWIFFSLVMILWFTLFTAYMSAPLRLIYMTLTKFSAAFIMINVVFLFIEQYRFLAMKGVTYVRGNTKAL